MGLEIHGCELVDRSIGLLFDEIQHAQQLVLGNEVVDSTAMGCGGDAARLAEKTNPAIHCRATYSKGVRDLLPAFEGLRLPCGDHTLAKIFR